MASSPDNNSALSAALKHLEIAEANLVKLEHLWGEINQLIPDGPAFGSTPEYEDKCRSYGVILPYLTKIDGWRPAAEPMEFDTIGQLRLDALEIGEIGATGSRSGHKVAVGSLPGTAATIGIYGEKDAS